ncbi:hypothetical protein QO239_22445 [Cupriavidus taiwanensis]|uniref:hypothetical protein n=1 Tax=Cupriavidus taiwanensis TaxID=164546 RepID=UPI0025406069|nr:hypothetical protein [Cupriavidus taiwanensis]MDK3025362.1 hypothetical protein [Cupriavidus taiwanensis]
MSTSGNNATGPVTENLLVNPPEGFVVGFQNRLPQTRIVEFVPRGQTVEQWMDMVTVQVFHQNKATSAQFATFMRATWEKACGIGTVSKLSEVSSNGYPAHRWMSNCALNPKSRQPENTMFLAIRGAEALYVVQVATKTKPNQDWMARTNAYLDSVLVCDPRSAQHPCPNLSPGIR